MLRSTRFPILLSIGKSAQLSARQASEKDANDDQSRPLARDVVERAKLRREAAAAKNEIELKVRERVKERVLRW
jgi:hypothetical protein